MSAISSISSSIPQPQAVPKPEALESSRAGPDHDGDSDDRGGAVKPTTNTSGQPLGQIVNAKA
jgi:hypothetical protein